MASDTSTLSSILTQEEIDALLDNSGKKLPQLIKTSTPQQSYPFFEKKVDSLVRFLIPTIQKITQAEDVSIFFKKSLISNLGDYLDLQNKSSILGMYSIEGWRQSCLITLDDGFCYTLIDMSLGGRRGTAALQITNRNYTNIEKNIVCSFFHAIQTNLKDALGESFIFENINTTPQTALIASPACEVIIAQMQIIIDERKGNIDIVIPTHIVNQIDPQEDTLPVLDDSDMAKALLNVPVTLKAVMDKKQVPFSKILKWKKGDLLDLSYFDGKPLEIMCVNKTVGKGTLHVDKKMFFVTMDKKKD